MKKQFLTLGLFLLAALAGINESNAQKAVTWSTPEKLDCTTDALHPVAGKEYTYEAEVATDPTITADQEGHWRFWATRDPNFIVDGVFNYDKAITEGANGILVEPLDYNKDFEDANADDDGKVKISWTSSLLNSVIKDKDSLYVVAYYENAAGCTDQANVWLLDPENYFTVDIIAMDQTKDFELSKNAYTAPIPEVCVDEIQSMTIKNGSLSYDYGDNYIYFEFIAANFTDYWIPEFSLDGLNAVQEPTYQFTYETPDKWASTAPTWQTLESGKTHIEPDGDYTDAGVSIFVRVKVDHNNYENLKGQTLTMYLDGQLADGMYDTVNETCTDPDPMGPDKNDFAKTTITERPKNTDTAMPAPHFMTKASVVN